MQTPWFIESSLQQYNTEPSSVSAQNDAVFGPAPDGGYWLVGLRRPNPLPAGLFDGVRWSTEHALADSVRSLGTARVAYVDELADVDTQADLAMTRRSMRAT